MCSVIILLFAIIAFCSQFFIYTYEIRTIASIWSDSIDLHEYYGYNVTDLCYSNPNSNSVDLSLIGSHFIYKINDTKNNIGKIYSKYINIHKFEHVWDSNESIQWGLFSMKNDKNSNLILAFRGTVNFEDIIHDIYLNREWFLCTYLSSNVTQECPLYFKHNVNKSDIEISYVYDGFSHILHYYDTIIESIKQVNNKYKNENKKFEKLIITGHSLGGAYAIVISILMEINNFHLKLNNQVITFGAPLAVGGYINEINELTNLKDNIFNFVTPLDPVPRLLGNNGFGQSIMPCFHSIGKLLNPNNYSEIHCQSSMFTETTSLFEGFGNFILLPLSNDKINDTCIVNKNDKENLLKYLMLPFYQFAKDRGNDLSKKFSNQHEKSKIFSQFYQTNCGNIWLAIFAHSQHFLENYINTLTKGCNYWNNNNNNQENGKFEIFYNVVNQRFNNSNYNSNEYCQENDMRFDFDECKNNFNKSKYEIINHTDFQELDAFISDQLWNLNELISILDGWVVTSAKTLGNMISYIISLISTFFYYLGYMFFGIFDMIKQWLI